MSISESVHVLSFGAFRLEPAGVELRHQPLGSLRELSHFWEFPSREMSFHGAWRGVLKSCNRWHCAELPRFCYLRRDVNRPGSQYGAHIARLLLFRSVFLQAVGLLFRSYRPRWSFCNSMSEARFVAPVSRMPQVSCVEKHTSALDWLSTGIGLIESKALDFKAPFEL